MKYERKRLTKSSGDEQKIKKKKWDEVPQRSQSLADVWSGSKFVARSRMRALDARSSVKDAFRSPKRGADVLGGVKVAA